MKKLFLLPLLFLATAVTVNAQDATTQTAPNPNGPQMKFDVMEHNFGTIKQGEVVTYEFKFKNSGKEPLVISTAVGSCGCTVPDWPKEPIAPGKTGIMKVTFNSTGKMGTIDKTVTITSNNRDGQLVLHMKGEVKPAEQPAQGTGNGSTMSTTTTSTTAPATVGTSTSAPTTDTKASTTTTTTTSTKASKGKKAKTATTSKSGN
jgi:hypothetical protein